MKRIFTCLLALILLVSAVLLPVPAAAADDPTASYVPLIAEHEDSAVSLWFDYNSRKVLQSDTASTGMNTFSAYLAKNEIENIQFVLTADEARTGLSAEVTPFENEDGASIAAELYIDWYHDCDRFGMVPDAIPPLSAYGAFDLVPGQSQAFLIKLKTGMDTPAGWYSATLTVTDGDGQAIKAATVFAYVWDFALSEETACATSINLDLGYLLRVYPEYRSDMTTIYQIYYDFMLENRINAYYLPYRFTSPQAEEYMNNPRVTSFQYGYNGTGYTPSQVRSTYRRTFADASAESWFNKAYYFTNIVDAATPADLEALRTAYDELAETVSDSVPEYADVPVWFINTYINDIDYTTADGTVIDQIEYYKDFVNLWCSKPFAYTDPDELSTRGAKVMQPLKWNSVYGTFKERMAERRAAGQKVWWFLSWDVEAPYINYYMQTDGTAQRILFWQQFDNDVQGFLYNFVNFWIGDAADPYIGNITNSAYPDAHGESILLYPGKNFGFDGPVSSLRLEALRDGIEDYQMLTMLEAIAGEGAADALIDQLTTGMTRYTTDAETYYQVRKALGAAVESADIVEEPEILVGDVNQDGNITPADLTLLRSYLIGDAKLTKEQYLAADLNQDNAVNTSDVTLLRRILCGG